MFDLSTEPWVPLIGPDGRTGIFSLEQALVDAHEFKGVDMVDPLIGAAVLRLMLALTIDATDVSSPQGWKQAWRAGRLDAVQVRSYLDGRRDRFDLFHPVHPFMQIADPSRTNEKRRSAVTLSLEQATGNNVPLFAARTEDADAPLTPAVAAQQLVALHAWDTAGIKTGLIGDRQMKAGKTTGNRTGPCGGLGLVLPTGRNLAETLLLSVVPARRSPDDRAAWDVDWGPNWESRQPVGVLELLTWQSRRVVLTPAQRDGETVVVECLVGGGDRMEFTPDRFEPHTTWAPVKPGGSGPAVRPVRHRVGREAWQGLTGLLAVRRTRDDAYTSRALEHIEVQAEDGIVPDDYPLGVTMVGVEYGTQSAVIEDVFHDHIPLPVVALRAASMADAAHLDQMVTEAEATARALNDLVNNARLSVGGDPIPWDKGQRPDVEFYAAISPHATRMLHGLSREPAKLADALAGWRTLLRTEAWRVADRELNRLPAEAFRGRGEGKGRLNQALTEIYFKSALNKALGKTAHGATR